MAGSGLRRSHAKSHHGCVQCKRRKIKCDERRDTCGPCIKRNIECEFQEATITETVDLASLPPSQLTIRFDRRSARPSIRFKSKKDLKDKNKKRDCKSPHLEQAQRHFGEFIAHSAPVLRMNISHPNTHPYLSHNERYLLHHYFMDTSNTLVLDGLMERHWVDLVPRCAQSHDYVLFGLLCVSALHLASLHFHHSQDRLTCMQYHNMAVENMCRAISKFRTDEKSLHAGNMDSVFAFSGISIISELALMADIVYGEKNDKKHVVDRFVRMAQLICNVSELWLSFPLSFYWKMNKEEVQWIKKIKAGTVPDIQREFCRIKDPGGVPEIFSTISRLHGLNCGNTVTDSTLERETYTEAINALHIKPYNYTTNPADWVVVLRCMTTRLATFIPLLQARKPFALIILAHYCVVIHHGPAAKAWWMRKWGQSMLHAIFDQLDDAWKPHLAWAMDAVRPGRKSPLIL